MLELFILMTTVLSFAFLLKLFLPFFKKQPKKNIAERYIRAKKQIKIKEQIILDLANENYYLNEFLHHYHFNIDGVRYIFGIIEMLDYFGEDVFRKANIIKKNQLKINRRKLLKVV